MAGISLDLELFGIPNLGIGIVESEKSCERVSLESVEKKGYMINYLFCLPLFNPLIPIDANKHQTLCKSN